MKVVRLALLVILFWWSLIGCEDRVTSPSGDGLTTATPAVSFPPGTTFSVVSGETGVPIVARFVVGGEELLSNDNGEVTINREARFSSPVDIVAAGYLDRNTIFKQGEFRYTLWPKTSLSGLTERSTAELVYTNAGLGTDAITGKEPLRRWRDELSQIDVIFGVGFDRTNEQQIDTQVEAVAEFNGVLPEGVLYAPPRFVSRPIRPYVDLRIQPDYPSCVESNFAALVIVGSFEYTLARIIYCSQSAASNKTIALHELGHTVGLQHSSSERDIMRAPPRVNSFHARENLLLSLMYQRRGGNLFPDNDRGSDRQTIGEILEFVCGTRSD